MAPPAATDADLLAQFTVGDRHAFEIIVQRYADMVYRTAMRIVGDAHAAEDITQDCFAALARDPHAVRQSLAGYLHARATSSSLNHLREAQRRRNREQVSRSMNPTGNAADPAAWSQLQPILDDVVNQLPDDLRQPIIMHYLQGADQQSVAERLGVHQSTVSRRITAALEQLRGALQQAGVALPVAALGALLHNQVATAAAAPPALVNGLTSLNVTTTTAACCTATATIAAATTTVTTVVKTVTAALVAAACITGGYLAYSHWSVPALPESEPSMPVQRVSLTNVQLKGNDHIDDSLSMAMIAAARLLDVPRIPDYDTIFCRSTNAFAPMIYTKENCTAHWHCDASLADRAIDHLAASLGLYAQRIDPPAFDKAWNDSRKLEACKLWAGAIAQHMAKGAVVLTTGGWDYRTNGFTYWGAAGIVTSADPQTGSITGAHPDGHTDTPMNFPVVTYAIGPDDTKSADPLATDRDTLRLAKQRITGVGRFKRTDIAHFGTDAMTTWANHMATVPGFCEPCFAQGPGRSVGDAMDNAQRMRKSAGIVATYLRSLRDTFPQAAHADLEAAAAHYDRIGELLAPSVTNGAAHYRNWLGDMAAQRAHAELLQGVDAELLAAADDMQQALNIAIGVPEPRFVDRPAFRVIGVEDDWQTLEQTDPGFADIWSKRFGPFDAQLLPFSPDKAHYNVFVFDSQNIQAGDPKRFIAAIEVTGNPILPGAPGWVVRDIPAAHYAVFDTTVRDVGQMWSAVINAWLPGSSWREDHTKCRLDMMPADTGNPDSPMTIWMPIVAKPTGTPQPFTVATLPPMRVAYTHHESASPEKPAIDALMQWLEANRSAVASSPPRFFGFNNPDPQQGVPTYGYEFQVAIAPDAQVHPSQQNVQFKNTPGGLYVCWQAPTIKEIWDAAHGPLPQWLDEHGYRHDAGRQWLEEHLPAANSNAAKRWRGFRIWLPIGPKPIAMTLPSDEPGNTYARAASAVLAHLGRDISYERIMGLSGVAFIVQVDTAGPMIDGRLDCAWWPNDAWGFTLGLPVLSQAAGWRISPIAADSRKADLAANYAAHFAQPVAESLADGRPVIAETDHAFIITAVDDGSPPLLGFGTHGKSTRFDPTLMRAGLYPWGLFTFEGPLRNPLPSPRQIDLASLQHIIALFNEQAQLTSGGGGAPTTRHSGKQAWADWLKLLQSGDDSAYDNNMLIHLRYNRACAVTYLRDMAGRYEGEAATCLSAAADLYQQVLDAANAVPLPTAAGPTGLSAYTAMVEHAAQLETQAVVELESAVVAIHPPRQVLTNVPRIGFFPDMRPLEPDRGPEDIIFPSAMRSVMQHLGHDEFDYIHFVGVTGAGFFLNWKDGWHGDNTAIYYMAPVAEHTKLFQYAFDSTGYGLQIVPLKGDHALDEAHAKARIIAAINAGRPVLAHGVVGPPETCIITGYDEAGDVLIGWSFFQYWPDIKAHLQFEPNGMFRKRNWFADTHDLLILGDRHEQIDPAVIHRRALQWAVKVARTPVTWGDRHNGLAAYDAWAAQLRHDADITPDGAIPAGSQDQPYGVHDDAVGTVAESRYFVGQYLRRIAKAEPAIAADLLAAADGYQREHDLMWKAWNAVGGNGRSPTQIAKFADPAVRRTLIDIIGQAKAEDEKAITHIEHALWLLDNQNLSVDLGGRRYDLRWLTPADLADARIPSNHNVELRAGADSPYARDIDPLYNLHCELLPPALPDVTDWFGYWKQLAHDKLSADQPFALLAYTDGQFAGYVRFFPAAVAHLRDLVPAALPADPSSTLLIGAAHIDLPAAADHLDVELLKHVTAYAAAHRYQRVTATGWPDSPVFALWGQQLRTSAYRAADFHPVAKFTDDRNHAFADQLAGAHGPAVQAAAQADAATGLTISQTSTFHIMTHDIPQLARTGRRVRIQNITLAQPLAEVLRWDSQLIGLQAMLAHRGESVTFDDLAALSGEAFLVTHIRRFEGGDAHLTAPITPLLNAGRALGYDSQFLTLGRPHVLRQQPDDQVQARTMQIVHQIFAEVDAGRPVFAPGVNTFCGSWGLITGYDPVTLEFFYDDGRQPHWQLIPGITGPTVSGAHGHWDSQVRGAVYQGHPLSKLGGWQGSAAFILGPKTRASDPATRAVAALGRAVELFHAPAGKSHWPHDAVFGERAYAAFAEDLTAFDPAVMNQFTREGAPANEHEYRNIELFIDQIVQGRSAAAAFCDHAAKLLPQTGDLLPGAAEHYRQQVALAQRAFAPWTPPTSKLDDTRIAWLKDDATRAAAVDTLKQMADHERAAVAAIAAALEKIQPAVQTSGTQTWLTAPVLATPGASSGLSHIHAVADTLRLHGRVVDFDFLMGVSGEAFTYAYHPDGTYLSQFTHNDDSALTALAAFGFTGVWHHTPPDTGPADALQLLQRELAAGRPVIAPGIRPSADGIHSDCHFWFVVTGIDPVHQQIALLDPADTSPHFLNLARGDSGNPVEHPRWYGIVRTTVNMHNHYGPNRQDNPLLIVHRSTTTPDRLAVIRASLQRAVDLAHAQPVQLAGWGGGTYHLGLDGLQRLVDDLAAAQGDGVAQFEKLNPVKGDPFRGIHEELQHLRLLADRRRSAAAFCRQAVDALPAARTDLLAAADAYDQVAQRALDAFILRHGPLADSDRIGEIAAREAYVNNPEWDAYWQRAGENLADPQKRQQMVAMLRKALDAERTAVASIESALQR